MTPSTPHRRPTVLRVLRGGGPRALLVALALCASAGVVPGAAADAGSRGEAIEEALAKSGGGQVLGVRESVGTDGRREYAVKVLTAGRVRIVRVRGR